MITTRLYNNFHMRCAAASKMYEEMMRPFVLPCPVGKELATCLQPLTQRKNLTIQWHGSGFDLWKDQIERGEVTPLSDLYMGDRKTAAGYAKGYEKPILICIEVEESLVKMDDFHRKLYVEAKDAHQVRLLSVCSLNPEYCKGNRHGQWYDIARLKACGKATKTFFKPMSRMNRKQIIGNDGLDGTDSEKVPSGVGCRF